MTIRPDQLDTGNRVETLYTISAAARRVQRRRATVRAWIQQGLLPFEMIDGDHAKYIKEADLLAVYRQTLTTRRLRPRDDAGRFISRI
ncbi:hypothetical protein C5B95_10675 [Rathayibacter sp. AY1A7]|nr:hypothetical protein [Microbacterium sp. VKM Ac-2923]PPF18982.1 hypothetical protein C5B95_10675 [Rathayibacter sp. AY1A7]